MSSNTYLEHVLVSQKARILAKDVYLATRKHKNITPDWGLAEQMHRAAICIMKSLEEGFAQTSAPDFHRSLAMAKGSCAEIRSQLHMALDIGFINHDQFESLMGQASEIASLLSDLRCPIEGREPQIAQGQY